MKKETDIATTFRSVHKKMPERGLITPKDLICILAVAAVLLFHSTMLYAQHQRVERRQMSIPAMQQQQQQQEEEWFETFTFPTDYFPRFALKTNLLYGATTTPNLGMEFFLNRFLTLDLSVGWNPFVFRNNRKFEHVMVQPTLRFWIQEPFNGHFLGLSLMYCDFNVSDIRQPYNWFGLFPGMKNHRFRGSAYSASLQYGHQWVLSPRWSIEASINVGYMFLEYRKYMSEWCGEHLGNDRRHYFGPTNAGITLIYVFR